MADGGHEAAHGLNSLWPTLAGLVGAAFGAAGLWLANRLVGKAAWQKVINEGFAELRAQQMAQHNEERRAWKEELDRERLAHAATQARLGGEILNLTQALESLKEHLRRRGIEIPRAYREPDAYLIIEGEAREK